MRGASILKPLKPVVIKEFRQISRDPISLVMLLILPPLIVIVVGYALNFDVKHIPLAVLDQCRSTESRSFVRAFNHTEYFDHRHNASSYSDLEELLADGEARVGLVIPPDFARNLAAGHTANVQVLVDGADNTTATQAVGYALKLTRNYSAGLFTQDIYKLGGHNHSPVDFQPRVWYNPDLISSRFLVPGLIGFIIMFTAVISTALTVVREKEQGTLEHIIVSPLSATTFVAGKTIPYLVIGIVSATLTVITGYVLFDVPVHGNVFLLYLAISVLLVAALGQGILISTITDSQQVAFMVAVSSTLMPTFLLSGFVFPISNMPLAIQGLSNLAVTKFFLIIVRRNMLKGADFMAVWDQFIYLLVFAIAVLSISIRRLRRQEMMT